MKFTYIPGENDHSPPGSGTAGDQVFLGDLAIRGGRPWFDVSAFGAIGDGVTDDSAAVISAIQAAYNAGGGIVVFPRGTYLILSQLAIPNDGASVPSQPSIRLTGAGSAMASADNGANITPRSGTILDLRNNATTAKIDTRGAGYLEIDHLTLKDGGSDAAAFVLTTNTVLHIHDCEFYGTTAASNGVSALNDGIILGGTGTNIDGTATSGFQGYGTVIRDNFFNNIKRAVLGQTFCNGVQIVNNTVWKGSGYATGGAFEFTGVNNPGYCTGCYLAGNLIEITFYQYGINLANFTTAFTLIGNNCYDSTTNSTACIQLGTNCLNHLVILGYGSVGTLPSVQNNSGNTSNTIIDAYGATGAITTLASPVTFVNTVSINNGLAHDLNFGSNTAIFGANQSVRVSDLLAALSSGSRIAWSLDTHAYDALDTSLSRSAAGIVAVGTGGQGSAAGTVQAAIHQCSTSGPTWTSGTGAPVSAPAGGKGSMFSRTDGAAGSTFYVWNGTSWTAVA